ncbi:MAG: phage holin family protein [Chitinophagaceae bacterium]
METAAAQLESLVTKAAELAETKLDIWKLKVSGKVSSAVSSLIGLIALVSLAAVSGILLSIGAAILIGQQTGNAAYGFLIMAGFYILCGLLLFIFRKAWIKDPVRHLLLNKLLE